MRLVDAPAAQAASFRLAVRMSAGNLVAVSAGGADNYAAHVFAEYGAGNAAG